MKRSLKSSEFKTRYISSKSLLAGDLHIRYIRDNQPSIGFIVSKKYGSAIERNLLKRRCRSIFSDLLLKGFDHTLIIRPRGHHITHKNLISSFSSFTNGVHY